MFGVWKGATWSPRAGFALSSPGCRQILQTSGRSRGASSDHGIRAEQEWGRGQVIKWWWSDKVTFTYGCFLKWWYPQIIYFNRVFHYFHHPFWGFSPNFRKPPYMEKRLWACPKVPFRGHHQEISRSDQESWALRIFCKPLAQLWHYGAWIFPTCFNTITNPENDNVLICHSSTVSRFIWSLERVAIMLQKGLVCGILSLPIRSFHLLFPWGSRFFSDGERHHLANPTCCEAIGLFWNEPCDINRKTSRFPIFVGDYQYVSVNEMYPPHEN